MHSASYIVAARDDTMPRSTIAEKGRQAGAKTRLSRARRTALLKALADPHRFHLVEQIANSGCPLGCAQARASLAIAPATLSHHIKELETAGIITVRREGKFHFLSLRPGVLDSLIATFESLARPACE
jgi:ArsR family transcriptional regulator, arsenate/arsenite/antimonite-responsive transcriptional repressor